MRLAPDPLSMVATTETAPLPALLLPSLAAAAAWACMSLLMGGSPLKLVDCGISEGATFGFIALHVFAMYAPAVPLIWLARHVAPRTLAVGGVILSLASVVLAAVTRNPPFSHLRFSSRAQAGVPQHRGRHRMASGAGTPAAGAAMHDFMLFGAALPGRAGCSLHLESAIRSE